MPGPTITVRGEGGAVSELDVPDEGTIQRELFDDHIAKGRYVVLSGDWPASDEDEAGSPLPGPADKVAAWRDYAASVDPDNAADIAKMTKAALIERYAPSDEDEALTELAEWAQAVVEAGDFPDVDSALAALGEG